MPGPHYRTAQATRLMPFQRALTFFLAALAVYVTLALLADLIKRYRLTIVNLGLVAGTLLTLLLYIFVDSSPVPESDRALYPVLNTGDSYMDQQHAVELANERDRQEPPFWCSAGSAAFSPALRSVLVDRVERERFLLFRRLALVLAEGPCRGVQP
ncbi:MAG: hypothetical protein R2855_16420 [Thermomicrobiales bacterium]